MTNDKQLPNPAYVPARMEPHVMTAEHKACCITCLDLQDRLPSTMALTNQPHPHTPAPHHLLPLAGQQQQRYHSNSTALTQQGSSSSSRDFGCMSLMSVSCWHSAPTPLLLEPPRDPHSLLAALVRLHLLTGLLLLLLPLELSARLSRPSLLGLLLRLRELKLGASYTVVRTSGCTTSASAPSDARRSCAAGRLHR
jgi:hypothetical protein